jgi:drug/metabolite transporter (DMT)-like permease
MGWQARVGALPLLGLATVFLSASLFGLCNVIVKSVESVDPFTIAFYRFLGIALPALSIVLLRGEVRGDGGRGPGIYLLAPQDPFPRGKRWVLVVRSLMGASNLVIHFYGLKHMPIGDLATLLGSTADFYS